MAPGQLHPWRKPGEGLQVVGSRVKAAGLVIGKTFSSTPEAEGWAIRVTNRPYLAVHRGVVHKRHQLDVRRRLALLYAVACRSWKRSLA